MSGDGMSIFLVILAIISAVFAVRLTREILFSAIALGVLSIILAIICFKLDSPYAGVFELSVCAGLITVLFVVVISLTKRE